MKMEMKNRSHIYDINLNLGTRKNRPRSRHGHKHSKYKKCLSMMTFVPNVPLLRLLKTSETQRLFVLTSGFLIFSGVHKKGTLGRNVKS